MIYSPKKHTKRNVIDYSKNRIIADDNYFYKISPRKENYIRNIHYYKKKVEHNKTENDIVVLPSATDELEKYNYLTKLPDVKYNRDQSPFEKPVNPTKKTQTLKNKVKNILYTPVFNLVTKFNNEENNEKIFKLTEDKYDEIGEKNLKKNIENNQTINQIKKTLMNNPNENFTGCRVKIDFKNYGVETETIEDNDWKLNKKGNYELVANQPQVDPEEKPATYETHFEKYDNTLTYQKFDQLNSIVDDLRKKKWQKEENKFSADLQLRAKSKSVPRNRNNPSLYNNRIDIFHQCFEKDSEILNDSIDWEEILQPSIETNTKKANLSTRIAKDIQEMVNYENVEKEYGYVRQQDAWFHKKCIDDLNKYKFEAKSQLFNIRVAKNEDDYKRIIRRKFTTGQLKTI